MSHTNMTARFWHSVATNIGLPIDALAFIYDTFGYARQSSEDGPNEATFHITATEYCDAFTRFAKQEFGNAYVSTLRSWNLDTSEKLGRIFDCLIERNLMGRQASDSPSDFNGQFDLSQIQVHEAKPVRYQHTSASFPFVQLPSQRIGLLTVVAVSACCAILLAVEASGLSNPISGLAIVAAFIAILLFAESLFWNKFHYNIRSLLVITTLAAIVLGIVAMLG